MNTLIKRVNNTLLPDKEELTVILKKEVTRNIPFSKLSIHYPQFNTIKALLEHFNLSTALFIDNSQTIFDVVSNGKILIEQTLQKIASTSLSITEINLFNSIYDYLSEEDSPKQSDIIFVFGGKTPLRPQKAAQLFAKKLSKLLIVSGGNPIYDKSGMDSEGFLYKNILIKYGVPEECIIVEDESITMPDNIRRSINLLDSKNIPYKSLILVNSPYTQRRGWTIFMKYLPESVTLYRVNSATAEEFSKENWYKKENTLRIVLNEFIKMRASVIHNTA